MDEVYVPPNLVDSHLFPYMADVLDEELKDTLEINEFSARYFKEKARKKHEGNEKMEKIFSPIVNRIEWIDPEAPDFSYDSFIELNPISLKESDLKADDTDKNENSVKLLEDEQMLGHLDTFIKNQFESDKEQNNYQVLHDYTDSETVDQIQEFAGLLPEYIALMVKLIEGLGEEVEVKETEKVFDNKQNESDKTTPSVFNGSELKVVSKPTHFRSTFSQTSPINENVCKNCKMMPIKEIIPLVLVEKDKDPTSPSVVKEATVCEKKPDVPKSLVQNDMKKEPQLFATQIPQNDATNGDEIFQPAFDPDTKTIHPTKGTIKCDLIKNLREKFKYKTNKSVDDFFVLVTKIYGDKGHPCLCHENLKDLKRDLVFAFELEGYEEDEDSLSNELLTPMQKSKDAGEIQSDMKCESDGQDDARKNLLPQSKRRPKQRFQEMNCKKTEDFKFNENGKSPMHDTFKLQYLGTKNQATTCKFLEKDDTPFSSVERNYHPATIYDSPKQNARGVKPKQQRLTSNSELNISKRFGEFRVPKLETNSIPFTAEIEICVTPVIKSTKGVSVEQQLLKKATKKDDKKSRGNPFDNKQEFRSMQQLKGNIQHLSQSQRLKNVEQLAKGNDSASRGCNEMILIPINGQTLLRTYFTVQTIKRIKEDDWRTLYVEDQDLRHPFRMAHNLSSPKPTDFLQWHEFFKAFRTWYFAKRLKAYQKHLRYKS